MLLTLLATVFLLRLPEGAIQPQVQTGLKGRVHLIYFQGDPAAGNVFYKSSQDSGATWTAPLRVNTQPNAAIAAGNVRGAHLALGRNARPHVAWMGSARTTPKSGLFYTRLNDRGDAFEPERNLIGRAWGLDGGATLAADPHGRVHVLWHAPAPHTEGEANRQVWISTSTDDGRTFAPEHAAWSEPTGACACCGMRAGVSANGSLRVLYRGARETVHRDMFLLTSKNHGATFTGVKIDEWEVGACVMSTAWLGATTAAWETTGQVHVLAGAKRLTPAGEAKRKHPVAATNKNGDTLLVWTEDMAWKKGGSVAWEVFSSAGVSKEKGRAPGVPAFSLVSAFARPDGSFAILY
jgi:hypothetical protein